MIVDTIAGFFTTVLGAIFNSLPSFTLTGGLGLPTAGSHSSDAPGEIIGSWIGGFDNIFPLHETVGYVYAAMLALLAAYAIYKIANWVWRHIPDLGGFGPGAG